MHNGDDGLCASRSIHKYTSSQGNISENGQKYIPVAIIVPLGVPRPSASLCSSNVNCYCIRVSLTTGSLMGHTTKSLVGGLMYSLVFSKPLNRERELKLNVIGRIEN